MKEQVIYLRWPEGIHFEFSANFLQAMLDRMLMSYFKYGKVSEGFPRKVDALATLRSKLEEYERTKNTEMLVDVANYAMIEFMHPKLEGAHYTPREASKGRIWNGEPQLVNDRNNLDG